MIETPGKHGMHHWNTIQEKEKEKKEEEKIKCAIQNYASTSLKEDNELKCSEEAGADRMKRINILSMKEETLG